MIKHIVMWKLKDFAAGASKEHNARKMKSELESLKNKISQIRHIEVGINFIETSSAYDIALYAEFENEKDVELYLKHSEHLKVADFIGQVREAKAVIDYKMD